MRVRDLLSDDVYDIADPVALRLMPLPADNCYAPDVCMMHRAWGCVPPQCFALIDDGGCEGERWIPVEVVASNSDIDPRLQRMLGFLERQVTAYFDGKYTEDADAESLMAHLRGNLVDAWPALMDGSPLLDPRR